LEWKKAFVLSTGSTCPLFDHHSLPLAPACAKRFLVAARFLPPLLDRRLSIAARFTVLQGLELAGTAEIDFAILD
jgi:hypothetical protein